jgi:polysaccharide biosynthesis protein PelA
MRLLLARRNALIAGGIGLASAATFGLWPALARQRRLPPRANWAVFYGDRSEISAFAGYDVIALDPHFTGDVAALTKAGATTLGYLSMGELSNRSPFFARLDDQAALLRENPNWPGSYAIDVRRPAWRRLVLEEIAPFIVAKGFNGLFLDTMDSLSQVENDDYEAYRGMRAAGADLVRAIRRAYPDLAIMMNRGYAVLGDVVDVIDAVLAESLVTTYDFKSKTYQWVASDDVQQHLQMLEPARKAGAPIFSLDYWSPDDVAGIQRIYQSERSMGHAPYVATILLNQLVREPA